MNAAELAKFPLLADLSSAEREIVAETFEVETVAAGVSLFREGDAPDGILFVAEGRIRVYTAEVGGEAELGAGDALGTLSIVDAGPRLASAETLSRTRLYRLRRGAFRNLVVSEPAVACTLLEGIVRESALALREEVQRGSAAVDPTQASD